MVNNVFTYKYYTITVNTNMIKIDKAKVGRLVCATLVYDRKSKKETFSGEFPYVVRGGQIHKVFDEIVSIIGTSTKVTLAKTPKVEAVLDGIRK